jgi:hypothetical protein
MGDKSEVVPDPEVLKLYDELRTLQARMYTVTEELGRRLAGGERWATILKRLEVAFDTAWCSRYAPGQTKKYQFHYMKDRPQWKRLYNRLGEPDLVERVGVYIRNSEQFFVHQPTCAGEPSPDRRAARVGVSAPAEVRERVAVRDDDGCKRGTASARDAAARGGTTW